jgi:hypothetical protein
MPYEQYQLAAARMPIDRRRNVIITIDPIVEYINGCLIGDPERPTGVGTMNSGLIFEILL